MHDAHRHRPSTEQTALVNNAQWQRCSTYILEELQWCVLPSLASLRLPAAASGFIQALETPQPQRLTVSHENGFEQRRD